MDSLIYHLSTKVNIVNTVYHSETVVVFVICICFPCKTFIPDRKCKKENIYELISENIYRCVWLFLTQPLKRYWEEAEKPDQRKPEEEQSKAAQNQNKARVQKRPFERKNYERYKPEVRVCFSIQ